MFCIMNIEALYSSPNARNTLGVTTIHMISFSKHSIRIAIMLLLVG